MVLRVPPVLVGAVVVVAAVVVVDAAAVAVDAAHANREAER